MNEDSFSVIIPARNAARTLQPCLESIRESRLQPLEILLVDDGSTDATSEIARRFQCKILSVNIQDGAMKPRFEGVRQAKGDVLVFMDSDVVIHPETFTRVFENFKDPGLSAVTGLLACSSRESGFFTQYKNEYMNFIFRKRAGETDFLYGSIFAVRRKDFLFFEPLTKPFTDVADSELGLLLSSSGKKLVLDEQIEVEHLKRYNLLTILQNDFVIPFMLTRLLFRYRRTKTAFHRKRFSHAPLLQVAAAAASFVLPFTLMMTAITGGVFWTLCAGVPAAVYFLFWMPFLKGLRSRRGILFTVKAAFFGLLDAFVMFCGMFCGAFYSLLKAFCGAEKPASLPLQKKPDFAAPFA